VTAPAADPAATLVDRVQRAAGDPAELAIVIAALYVRTDLLAEKIGELAARLAAREEASP
jgi:hypothetical protein